MTDIIMGMVEFLFAAIAGFGSNSVVGPETFNATIYTETLNICNNVVKPFGYILLSCFGLFELINITTRTEGHNGTLGFEIPTKFMLKFALAKLFLDEIEWVLLGINDVASDLISGISYSGDTLVDISSGQDTIRTVVESQSFLAQIGTLGQILVMWFLMLIITVVIIAILYGRMIQIYVMMAIAPIPFSTFVNQEASSIGKNFIKTFAATCLQGVLIFIILRFYGTLVNDVLSAIDFTDWSEAFSSMLMTSVVLLLSLVMSGSLAKSILNAM